MITLYCNGQAYAVWSEEAGMWFTPYESGRWCGYSLEHVADAVWEEI